MIRSICFNPVIDRMYFIDGFCEGHKFREIKPQICVGGKGVNIARVAALLSEPCVLYAFAGGYGKTLICEEMNRLGVVFKYCDIADETRITINIINNAQGQETEITEQGAAVSHQQEDELMRLIKDDIAPGDIVICSGIPMEGMSAGVYKTISGWCEAAGAQCVIDTNNRYLQESLPARYSLMKPNLEEMKELHQIDMIENEAVMASLARNTLDMGVENLLVSTGGNGGFFFNKKQAFRITVPQIHMVSTIGSGDSTVAGFCIGLSRGYPLTECIKLAMACGICNAMFAQVGYVKENTVKELIPQIRIDSL